MSAQGFKVLDGAELRSTDFTLPETSGTITGARLIQLLESTFSSSQFGITLPEALKSAALRRLNADDAFPTKELEVDEASATVKDLITAIADELEDDPLVVAVMDGQSIGMFMEDEDDFAMLAENLFTDLDTEDKGKISKREIRKALAYMGVEMGIPSPSEFPVLNDILKKHGADEEKELGQAQFAQVLQPILQELASALALHSIVIIQNMKYINGSKLTKLLANEKLLNNKVEKILQECQDGKDEQSVLLLRKYLEKNGWDLGLPPTGADESVVLLYDSVFADVIAEKKSASESETDDFTALLKKILAKFAEQLEISPILYNLDI